MMLIDKKKTPLLLKVAYAGRQFRTYELQTLHYQKSVNSRVLVSIQKNVKIFLPPHF